MKYDLKAKQSNIKISDEVLLSNEMRHKFKPWNKGPYNIKQVDKVNYTILTESV